MNRDVLRHRLLPALDLHDDLRLTGARSGVLTHQPTVVRQEGASGLLPVRPWLRSPPFGGGAHVLPTLPTCEPRRGTLL